MREISEMSKNHRKKMLLRTAQKSGKFFWSVGLIELIPTKKNLWLFIRNGERIVLDLKSLGLNVGENTCVERIFQRRDVRGKKVELK